MLPHQDTKCHLTGFEESCRKLVCEGACSRWKQLVGSDPRTGAPLDLWDCIDNHAHTLRVCAVKAIESNSAAVESMRNEAKEAHGEQITMAAIATDRARHAIRDVFISGEYGNGPPMALTDGTRHDG